LAAPLLAGGSVAFNAVAQFAALFWLTTRRKPETPWIARVALLVAFIVAWGALRGAREGAPLWEVLANRAVDRLMPNEPPALLVLPQLRTVLETCGPLLATAALAARGQMPAVTGAFALALLAGPSTDVPLSALALTLAALSASLAAHDDRGMWAVLLSNSPHP
jgi:hypothetical protein